jgi:hypothetical protein
MFSRSSESAREILEPGEELVGRLDGRGATLLLTQRRVVIVREGSGFRPRSGIRSWPYSSITGVTLSPPKRGQAQVVIRTGRAAWQAVSMFFAAELMTDAEDLIQEIRRQIL